MIDHTITVHNLEELAAKMNTMDFSVQWKVSSDIGPSWIGSARTIDFYLDDFVLTETAFCKKLKIKLQQSIPIPNSSKDHMIYGDGAITIKKNQLEINYEWEATIPYQNPGKSEQGKRLFYP